MLNFFAIRSFKMKLLIIIWIGSTATLLLASGGFIFFEVKQFDRDLTKELKVIAAFIADKSTPAIMFNDPAIAEDALLSAAATEQAIMGATVYNIKGDVIATYARDTEYQSLEISALQTDTILIKNSHLHLFSAINMYSDHIGTVYIMAGRDLLYARLQRYGVIVAAIMATSLLFLLAISFVLQKLVSAPVMALIASAKQVAKEKDYSVRVQKYSEDELGLLADTFNDMLAQIQERDRCLRESRRLITDISANIPGLVFQFYARKDGELGLNYVSERSEEIFGLPAQCEGYFERFREQIAPESREEFLTSINRAVNTQTPWGYIGEFVRPDGNRIWIEGVAHPRIKEDEQVFDGVILDITEQKKGERNYREIFDATNAAIFLHDAADGSIIDVNQTMLDMYGYEREELSELAISDLSSGRHPYTQEESGSLIQKAVAGKPQVFDWQARRKNGEIFWMEVALSASKIGGENRVLAICQDISARKRAEEELKKNEEQLLLTRQTVEYGSTPTIWFKSPNQYYYVNQAACQATGYSREEMLALPPGSLHPQQSTEYWDKFFPALRQEKSLIKDLELRKKDGTIFPVLLNATYLEYQDDEYTVVTFYDLSDIKKLESELRQAQKMEAIGTLAGGIAHDFNNILSAIFGYTELARMRAENNPKLLEDLDEVYKGADRAKNLVKQILTFSRRNEQEKRPLQVALIVKESLKLLRSSLPTSIEIKQNITSQGTVLADPTQIHQVMMNLCTNAYHAMRDGGGILGVVLAEIEISVDDIIPGLNILPGRYLQLEISDTGIGMNKKTCEQIFEPYFTTKEAGEGTGLGLAVVHGIVESHHGYINVYSEPDQGSSFHVYLPLTKDEAEKQTTAAAAEPLPRGHERIMFVDDEKQITGMARAILPRYGYRLDTFADGELAWQEFKKNPDQYDLVITDMTMPKMNGAELARKILELRPAQPIFLCTGFSEVLNREEAKAMGIGKYIPKPLVMSKLLRSIKQILTENSQS